jgi:hypothetical protein
MTEPGSNSSPNKRKIALIIAIFLVSRAMTAAFGIHLEYDALFKYWQYLDLETLKHHLLLGIWYDHAQPPCFNILLALVLRIGGNNAPFLFAGLLHLISLANTLLLFSILPRLIRNSFIPLLLSLLYLLSPGLLIFESELFYTTFISLLLLLSTHAILRLKTDHRWTTVAGVLIPLVIACLTRSMYHLLWLAAIAGTLLLLLKKDPAFKRLAIGSVLSLLVTSGWYVKNYIVFGEFSTSSWIGMNLARTVFHDHPSKDSSRIEAYEPFSDINTYKPFIHTDAAAHYAGLDDRDLLQVYKNDSFLNENNINYIDLSHQYMTASKAYVRAHPIDYLKNVGQSAIMFFAPATRYPFAEVQAKKISYYDLLYSFNLSQLVTGKEPRKIALALSALPKCLIYIWVFFIILRSAIRQKMPSPVNAFILLTILFSFGVSSFIEHYENMRFRFEVEPLFLVLLGQALSTTPFFKTKGSPKHSVK